MKVEWKAVESRQKRKIMQSSLLLKVKVARQRKELIRWQTRKNRNGREKT